MTSPSIPTVELEGPFGRRVLVAPRSTDDRVGDLADALGLDPHQPLRLDGHAVGRHEALGRAGVVQGSRLEPDVDGQCAGVKVPLVVVVVEAGPGAGAVVTLGAGRHVVGRSATVAVPLADRALEPHHGLLDVDPHGGVRFVQLTGRVTARVGGEPTSATATLCDGSVLVLGASRLRIGRTVGPTGGGAAVSGTPGDPWRRTLHRTPRGRPRWDPTPVTIPADTAPSSRPSGAGLVAAAFTLVGSVVVAVVLRSPMFLVFGVVGVFATLGMWIAGRLGSVRDGRRAGAGRRRDTAMFAAAVAEQRATRWQHLLATTPGAAEAVTVATTAGGALWARRPDHDDAFGVTLGWGPVHWAAVLGGDPTDLTPDLLAIVGAAERFDDAPVPVELGPGAALAVTGKGAVAVVRSLVVQLATWVGPADWRLVTVVDDPDAWDWCRWLPHAVPSGGAPAVVDADDLAGVAAMLARLDDGDDRHVVVVTDRPELLAQRTGALRRFVGTASSVAVVVHVPDGEAVPAVCRSVVEIGSIGMARWWVDTSVAARSDPVHTAGVATTTAARVARALAGLCDPEDPAAAAGALPVAVGLGALCERHGVGPIDDAIAIAAAWRSAGADPPPAAPVGLTADGVVEIDLERDGPHALIAGTTGSGKSELLRTLVVSLAARCSPDHLTFVLVDYKGGSTFDACAELPHTVGLVTDLDDRLARRALVSLEAEIRRRERILREAGVTDLVEYRAQLERAPLPRLAVIIDEFATLAAELPTFLSSLVGIAQRGRSLGIHLVLATQRPAGVVSDDIRANTNLRVALRLQDGGDARDVVGDDGPVGFPRGTPGRTMIRLGPGETVVFQAAKSTGPLPPRRDERLRVVAGTGTTVDVTAGALTELAVLVRSIRHAAALSDVVAPHRPWLEPLPERVGEADGGGPGAVGVVDVPAQQRRTTLSWEPGDGNLALVGALGTGTTTALSRVVVAACHGRRPDERHVYVIVANGDDHIDDLARLAHCGGLVRPHERERMARLLRRLVAELDRRRSAGGRDGTPEIVLAIDGVGPLRATLEGPSDVTGFDQLLRILNEGPALGIACVVTAERPAAITPMVLAACAERWVFHLDDPAEAPTCGVPMARVPVAVPGRIVVASTGLDAQIVDEPVPRVAVRSALMTGGPAPIGVLPIDVDAAALPLGRVGTSGEVELVVGVDFVDLDVAALEVPDGEHVLVVGPARSGRTTAVVRLAESWLGAHPHGAVRVVAPSRRSPLSAWVESAGGGAGAAVTGRDVAALPLAAVLSAGGGPAGGCLTSPSLLVIDDAERVDDVAGALASIVAERRPGLLVIAAGRPDSLRTMYGHWTAVVRRSRLGLLMAACADNDGEVLGELLPRHPPLTARPGLAWVVGAGRRTLVQVARRAPGRSTSDGVSPP